MYRKINYYNLISGRPLSEIIDRAELFYRERMKITPTACEVSPPVMPFDCAIAKINGIWVYPAEIPRNYFAIGIGGDMGKFDRVRMYYLDTHNTSGWSSAAADAIIAFNHIYHQLPKRILVKEALLRARKIFGFQFYHRVKIADVAVKPNRGLYINEFILT